MKISYNKIKLEFAEPKLIDFSKYKKAAKFVSNIYSYLYVQLNSQNGLFQIDFDTLDKKRLLKSIESCEVRQNLKRANGSSFPAGEWKKDTIGKAFQLFFACFPDFGLMITNLHTELDITIKNAEKLHGASVTTENFLKVKVEIDRINRMRWKREQSQNEKQAGVSILGSISEKLIEIAMNDLIDGEKFLRSQNQDVQSYGDFVLMCLPNNLWLSVKSNFARERLLASGFSSDIIGVGFFTDYKEFTSRSKIRNFLKVGFLGMYIPDVPITEVQIMAKISTYEQLQKHYTDNNLNMPTNINGKPFLRPLSQLYKDLSGLIDIKVTSQRTIINF